MIAILILTLKHWISHMQLLGKDTHCASSGQPTIFEPHKTSISSIYIYMTCNALYYFYITDPALL